MITMPEIDYDSAAANFVVANTPMFLLRKLRSDPAVLKLSQNLTGEQIFEQLISSIEKKPESLIETVMPYVLLVALSHRGDLRRLREASQRNAPFSEWFKEMAINLNKTEIPMTINKITPPGHQPNQGQQTAGSPMTSQLIK